MCYMQSLFYDALRTGYKGVFHLLRIQHTTLLADNRQLAAPVFFRSGHWWSVPKLILISAYRTIPVQTFYLHNLSFVNLVLS